MIVGKNPSNENISCLVEATLKKELIKINQSKDNLSISELGDLNKLKQNEERHKPAKTVAYVAGAIAVGLALDLITKHIETHSFLAKADIPYLFFFGLFFTLSIVAAVPRLFSLPNMIRMFRTSPGE